MSRERKINNILTKEVLERDYKELQSMHKIAKKHGISRETVRYYIHQYGIEYNILKRYNVDHDFFQRENEKTFYVAGFIAADGCIKDRKCSKYNIRYEVQISLSKDDKEFLEKLRSIMNTDVPIRDFLVKNSKRNPRWNDTWKSELTITSEKMCKDLQRFNIVPRKSLIYTFPEWMENHPLKHHFIRGYNDGDGSFFIPKLGKGRYAEQIFFSMRGTSEFLTNVRSILEQECGLEKRQKPIRISSKHGILEYGGNGVLTKIVQYLYRDATIYLPRKYAKIKHLL